jgi:hypothetical protein
MQHKPNLAATACAELLGIASSTNAIAQANNCPFAVSGASVPTLARDGLMLARYAPGVRDQALIEKTDTTKSPSAAESSLIDTALRPDLDGNMQQTTQVGCAEDDRGVALAVNANNVYIGGATFGSLVNATQGFIEAIVLKFAY